MNEKGDSTEKNGRGKRLLVIGIGEGTSEVLKRYYTFKDRNVTTLAIGTDPSHLLQMLADRRFYIGNNPVKGLPSISPKKGELLVLKSRESLRPLLKGYRFIIILTGLGGGTGTGAAPELAKILKRLNPRSKIVGLVTLPFEQEGIVRNENAIMGLDKMRRVCNSTVVIQNSSILKLLNRPRLNEAFELLDDILLLTLDRIVNILLYPNSYHMKCKDVSRFFSGRSITMVGIGSSNNLSENIYFALLDSLNSPLLYCDKQNAIKALFLLEGKDISVRKIKEAISRIGFRFNGRTRIMIGYRNDEELEASAKSMVFLKFKLAYIYKVEDKSSSR
ncbi:MAG: hypothetical protein F9Y92_05770 [Thermoplasmatales archaeon]|nr:hypothetical protein [Thermoplasmatales archaeon]